MEDQDPLQTWLKAAMDEKFSERRCTNFKTMLSQLGLSTSGDRAQDLVDWCERLAVSGRKTDDAVEAALLEFAEKDAVPQGCRGAVQRGLSVLMLALDAEWTKREQSRGTFCGWRAGVAGGVSVFEGEHVSSVCAC